MAVALLLVRLLLAFVFLTAGLAKMADLEDSRQSLRDCGVPSSIAAPFGLLLPLAELAVVVALAFTISAWWGALGALALLVLFMIGIGYNLARGRQLLLQEEREVAEIYKVDGTPGAVLVYPDGTIGSSLALGADAIRSLVASVVSKPVLKTVLATAVLAGD